MFTNCYPAPLPRRTEVALLLTAAVVALAILLPIPARAQQETVLYNFNYPISPLSPLGCPPVPGEPVNEKPHTGLLFYKGQLYGTTPEGNAGTRAGDGMVFRLTQPASGGTPWNEQTLHSFQPEGVDGLYPCSRLIENNGTLYGSTLAGGTVVLAPYSRWSLPQPARLPGRNISSTLFWEATVRSPTTA